MTRDLIGRMRMMNSRLVSDAADEIERLRAEVADAVRAIDALHEKRRALETEAEALRALLLRWRDYAEDGVGSGELIAMTDVALNHGDGNETALHAPQ